MRAVRIPDALAFDRRKFRPRLLWGSDRVRAFLLCLEPGQALPAREDPEEMICYVVEGRARLSLGEEVLSVSAGDFAAAAPGQRRGLEAEERLVAIWIHISGGQADHA